jgi:hypothetical protein
MPSHLSGSNVKAIQYSSILQQGEQSRGMLLETCALRSLLQIRTTCTTRLRFAVASHHIRHSKVLSRMSTSLRKNTVAKASTRGERPERCVMLEIEPTHISTWYDNNSDGFQETKASVSFVRSEHRCITCPIRRARPESKAGTASSLHKGKTLPRQTLVSP